MRAIAMLMSISGLMYDLGQAYSSGLTQDMQLDKPIAITQTTLLKLGQECYASEQCNHTDPHATCTFSGTLDARPMICKCRFGFIAEEIEGQRMCIPIPHLDSRDTVPVVMGCLAAGLAVFACCAGIFQLISKQKRCFIFQSSFAESDTTIHKIHLDACRSLNVSLHPSSSLLLLGLVLLH